MKRGYAVLGAALGMWAINSVSMFVLLRSGNWSLLLTDDMPLVSAQFGAFHLAERLLESLDTEPGFALSEQWLEEISRRAEEIDGGAVELVSAEQVFADTFEALG